MNSKRPIPTHTILKMPTVKDEKRILKVAKEKLVTYKGAPITVS